MGQTSRTREPRCRCVQITCLLLSTRSRDGSQQSDHPTRRRKGVATTLHDGYCDAFQPEPFTGMAFLLHARVCSLQSWSTGHLGSTRWALYWCS
jgi:hypothetical protein